MSRAECEGLTWVGGSSIWWFSLQLKFKTSLARSRSLSLSLSLLFPLFSSLSLSLSLSLFSSLPLRLLFVFQDPETSESDFRTDNIRGGFPPPTKDSFFPSPSFLSWVPCPPPYGANQAEEEEEEGGRGGGTQSQFTSTFITTWTKHLHSNWTSRCLTCTTVLWLSGSV